MSADENNKRFKYSAPKHTVRLAYAFAVFTAIWILAVFGGIKWSSLDDPVISYLIRHSSENVTNFQQGWLVKSVNLLDMYLPLVNHWALLNIFGISSGAAACCWTVSERSGRGFSFVFSVLAVMVSYTFVLRAINFTCSSLVTFCGGAALAINSVCDEKKEKTAGYIIGIILMLIAFGIRKEAGFIGLGYLAVLGALSLDFSASPLKRTFYIKNKRKIILLVIPALICLGSVSVNRLMYTDAEKEYDLYNKVCAEIRDYSAAYPSWESGKETYASIGISPNDYDLLFNRWVFDDTEVFSQEKLEEIAELKFSKTPLSTFLIMPFGAFRSMLGEVRLTVLLALGIAVSAIWVIKKRVHPWKIITLWLFEFCYYMYIVLNGRIVTHVLFSILCGLDISLVLIRCVDFQIVEAEESSEKTACSTLTYPCVLLLMAIAAVIGIKISGNTLQTVYDDFGTAPNDNRAFYDVLDSRREDTFILAPNLNKHSSQSYGPWSPFPEKYCENVFYLGGWQARTGYMVKNLRSRGIENPMRALLEGEKVYSMIDENTPCILTFLREHYDQFASYSIIDLIGSNQIIRYCGSICKYESAVPEKISETHSASCNMSAGIPMVIVSGELTKDEGFENISDVYCSMQAGDNEYSFALGYDGNCSFSGCPVVISGSGAEPDLSTIKILIKTSEGKLFEVTERKENN